MSLSLSHDGNTIAIGDWAADPLTTGNDNAGTVAVIDYDGVGTWSLRGGIFITGAMLVDTGDGHSALAGASAQLSADGNTVAVGGRGAHSNKGVVQVFAWNGAAWIQLTADAYVDGNRGEVDDDRLGYDVALSADGLTLAAGAYKHDGLRGYARVYRAYFHASPPALPPPPLPPLLPSRPAVPPATPRCRRRRLPRDRHRASSARTSTAKGRRPVWAGGGAQRRRLGRGGRWRAQ